MKLYLESQVREKMLGKFGSEEGLEKAKAAKVPSPQAIFCFVKSRFFVFEQLKAIERKMKQKGITDWR